jgi:hypothetical protein
VLAGEQQTITSITDEAVMDNVTLVRKSVTWTGRSRRSRSLAAAGRVMTPE